jgi:hypothetical protein
MHHFWAFYTCPDVSGHADLENQCEIALHAAATKLEAILSVCRLSRDTFLLFSVGKLSKYLLQVDTLAGSVGAGQEDHLAVS